MEYARVTAGIDTRTERLLQKGLEKLLAGRTSFIIAHRLSTIRSVDRIFAIDDGRILETGVHDEPAKKGLYYWLFTVAYNYSITLSHLH